MYIFFLVLAIISIGVTIIATIQRKAWWIRIFDFPRLQIIILQLFSGIGMAFFIESFTIVNIIIAALLLVTIFIQLKYVFPYFRFAKKDIPDCNKTKSAALSFMVSNVLQKNRQYRKLISIIKKEKPSILLLVETNHWWAEKLKQIDALYTYSVKHPLDNTYGMMLYSKFPLKNTHIDFLVKKNIPSIQTEVQVDNFKFKLACLHPEPPAPDEAKMSRPRDRELIKMAKKIREKPIPYVVLGDLNDVPWSDTSYKFERISGLKDPRRGRGFFNTFSAQIPLLRFALDHIFFSGHFEVAAMKRLPKIGSDHFPIFISCCIRYSP